MSSDEDRAEDRRRTLQRRGCVVQGIVQGVGFRPFVHGLATDLWLAGFVRNQSGLVYLEVEGTAESLDQFSVRLANHAPPLARVDSIEWQTLVASGEIGFRIAASVAIHAHQVFISADVATCADCLSELFDPTDRRYRYPFLNCTNCGPRLTIIRGAPYDRRRTTMSSFTMCAACQREYEDPRNRRFHAQPIACAQCGPHLRLLTNTGERIDTIDVLEDFAAAIRAGKIGALKGLGGYHLVCDARVEEVVAELRRRKHRDQKPFAVMVGDLEQAKHLCKIDAVEAELLCSSRRPIVLLQANDGVCETQIARSVAPGNPYLGLMLPYTPLHHLLLRALDHQPLVMTSGNRADEPIAYDDSDAIERLGSLVEMILTHDRPIHVRCDDSVTRSIDGRESLQRRSRGYAPTSLPLPIALGCPTLAVGGQLKSTFALGRERSALLSHHLGDLDHFAAYQAFERDVRLYEDLFDTKPDLLVHDLHPDYASTRYAQRRAVADGLRLLPVQHHHAHIASCMAEHGVSGPVIGIAFDGTGYGTDGAIWGGEFLIATNADFQRAGHLRYVGLPGGDAAIREPWRSAVTHLLDAGCELSMLAKSIPGPVLRTIEQMIARHFNTPQTSSVGRLFDAVAAMVGIRTQVSYEGQAAVELELLATGTASDRSYPFQVTENSSPTPHPRLIVDTRPLVRSVVEDVSANCEKRLIARRFHSTVVQMVIEVCQQLRSIWSLEQVVLSGGVFMNALLLREAVQRLTADGFRVYRHHAVPCNDGGLSLGQLAVAAARDSTSRSI